MRKLKNDEEQSQRKSAPHQKSLSDWAIKIIEILKLKPGGPRLNKEGQVVYDVAPTSYRWKRGPGSRSDKTEGTCTKERTTTGIEFKGSVGQEQIGGGGARGTSPPGTEGAPFTIANQNSNPKVAYYSKRGRY